MAACVFYNKDITIHEGATYDKWFRWLVNSVQVSLVGVTGNMQIRKRITDDTALLTIPFSMSPWVEDGDTGIYIQDVGVDDRYRIYIRDNDSVGICALHKNITGTYDLFLYNPFGESILKQYGVANIIAAVTR
jgi:hypothetical protein